MSTKYKWQAVSKLGNNPEEVNGSGTTSYVDRPSLTLKLGYHYQIDAKTGVVTPTKTLVMD
jgi:hypothetical protein